MSNGNKFRDISDGKFQEEIYKLSCVEENLKPIDDTLDWVNIIGKEERPGLKSVNLGQNNERSEQRHPLSRRNAPGETGSNWMENGDWLFSTWELYMLLGT